MTERYRTAFDCPNLRILPENHAIQQAIFRPRPVRAFSGTEIAKDEQVKREQGDRGREARKER